MRGRFLTSYTTLCIAIKNSDFTILCGQVPDFLYHNYNAIDSYWAKKCSCQQSLEINYCSRWWWTWPQNTLLAIHLYHVIDIVLRTGTGGGHLNMKVTYNASTYRRAEVGAFGVRCLHLTYMLGSHASVNMLDLHVNHTNR